LTLQIAVLDWIELRNLYPYLLPDEVEQIIRIRSYQNELLYAEGRFADVSAQADKMLALNPDSVEGLAWKAAALGRLDRSGEADQYFERAIRSHPDSVLVLTQAAYYYFFWSPGRAWAYKAWPLLSRALSLDPGNETALWLASAYLMDEGRCSEALVLASRNADMNSDNPNPWRMLGDAYWCLGSREMARASYQRAILLSPSLEPYLEERLVQP
jgi:cytochrome c-type biogenesis protein CcmH/NrfG